jgi:hypothetical protein
MIRPETAAEQGKQERRRRMKVSVLQLQPLSPLVSACSRSICLVDVSVCLCLPLCRPSNMATEYATVLARTMTAITSLYILIGWRKIHAGCGFAVHLLFSAALLMFLCWLCFVL